MNLPSCNGELKDLSTTVTTETDVSNSTPPSFSVEVVISGYSDMFGSSWLDSDHYQAKTEHCKQTLAICHLSIASEW
eukprot:m.356428 g.356428  ORF g.356428 m.356428 type:complete len:77 (-) comp17541_c0_seq1:1893-2123(-)